MPNKTTLQEATRSPIDGTEEVRLATPGANWKAPVSALSVFGNRIKLVADTNFFVSLSGSDSNDGTTLGTAWATTQHAAFALAANYDFAGFRAIVNVGAGTFAGFGVASCVGGGKLKFAGAGSTLTTLTSGPNDGNFNFGENVTINQNGFFDTELVVNGFTLSNPGASTFGVGIAIYNPAVISIDDINIQAVNEGIGTFAPCIVFVNNVTVPNVNALNLLFFLTIYSQAQFFGTVTYTGNPHINTVFQLEQYSLGENFGGNFTGTFTPTNTVVVLEWYSNTNFALGTFGSISIGAGSFFADPTAVLSTAYQFQQSAGASTGLANLTTNNWGSFKDFTQSTGYGNFFAANDAGTTVFTGKIGKFTVATLPAGKPATTEAWVTDGNAPTFSSVAAGGGGVFTPVYFDGTNWRFG